MFVRINIMSRKQSRNTNASKQKPQQHKHLSILNIILKYAFRYARCALYFFSIQQQCTLDLFLTYIFLIIHSFVRSFTSIFVWIQITEREKCECSKKLSDIYCIKRIEWIHPEITRISLVSHVIWIKPNQTDYIFT